MPLQALCIILQLWIETGVIVPKCWNLGQMGDFFYTCDTDDLENH